MSTLYITEFTNLGRDAASLIVPAAGLLPTAEQTVAIGATSVQSSALNPLTHLIRLHTDSICSVAAGVNPAATTSSMRMAADQTEYFIVTPGLGIKIATIGNV
jgi:hypothetical protein